MKRYLQSIVAIFGLCLAFSAHTVEPTITEVESADLNQLAEEAAAENKQLMIIYYRDHCKACEQLVSAQGDDDTMLNKTSQNYKIYKTNAANGFDVVCPNGEQLSNNEFMSVKGITSLPAVVITDKFGSVQVVENNVKDAQQLLAISDLFKTQRAVKHMAGEFVY